VIVSLRDRVLVAPQAIADPQVQALAESMHAPQFVADLLWQHGVFDTEAARTFLVPSAEQLCSAHQMQDLDLAVDLLLGILERQEKLVIHGDYDVDGLTATALLITGLRDLGFTQVEWFVPNRFTEGYGLICDTVRALAQKGVQWILTVDTGINAVEEVALANSLGIQVIVTDHHQEGPDLPPAAAIINPNRKTCTYPNKFLSGVGVAWKVLDTLMRRLGRPEGAGAYLDFVALGTLADLMPLVSENRFLVKQGLRQLIQSTRPGFKVLAQEAKIDQEFPRAQDVLFRLTPLINAAGRMGTPEKALRILLAKDQAEAQYCLAELKECNVERRKCEAEMVKEAVDRVENDPELFRAPVLVIGDPKWNQGVVGIVAARLIEKFHRPVAVLSYKGNEGKASCRTVEGFNWHKALGESQDLLVKWGGHCYAAGFTVVVDRVAELRRRLCAIAERVDFSPKAIREVKPQYVLDFKDLNQECHLWLQRLEPFGNQHQAPLFYASKVFLVGQPEIVGTEHLRLKLRQGDVVIDAIAFQQRPALEMLRGRKDPIAIAYWPVWTQWGRRAERTLQLQIQAFGDN
jgi:single-stranded-DNA-specific exonuclease